MAASSTEPKTGGPVALDPLSFTPEGTGYRVRLTGNFDASWIRTYLALWTGSNFFSRFHLDVASESIWVPPPEGDGEKDLALYLEIVGAIVQVTSRFAVPNPQPGFAALRRNRLAPGARLQLHLPVPLPPKPMPERPPVVWKEQVEDIIDEIDSLVEEDLIEV